MIISSPKGTAWISFPEPHDTRVLGRVRADEVGEIPGVAVYHTQEYVRVYDDSDKLLARLYAEDITIYRFGRECIILLLYGDAVPSRRATVFDAEVVYVEGMYELPPDISVLIDAKGGERDGV